MLFLFLKFIAICVGLVLAVILADRVFGWILDTFVGP